MSAMEEVIRKMAYELWKQAGRPDGRSDEFWFAARIRIGTQGGDGRDTAGRACPPACGCASS